MGIPPATAAEISALEHGYRYGDSRLLRQRSQIVLLSYELESQEEIARVMHCSRHTVLRTLQLYRQGGRSALRPALRSKSSGQRINLAWQKALAEAMRLGPQASGVSRPTWAVRHKAQEQPDYSPKGPGSRRS